MDARELLLLHGNFAIEPPALANQLRELLEGYARNEALDDRARALIERAALDGAVGFREGWISFTLLSRRMANYDMAWAPGEIAAMLGRLGYVKHPRLRDGRTDNAVYPDQARARLYVRPDHPSIQLTRARDVARAYQRGQGYGFAA